jgi:hypothetical protein
LENILHPRFQYCEGKTGRSYPGAKAGVSHLTI